MQSEFPTANFFSGNEPAFNNRTENLRSDVKRLEKIDETDRRFEELMEDSRENSDKSVDIPLVMDTLDTGKAQITTPVMDTLDTNKAQITTPVMDTLDTNKAQITTPVMDTLDTNKTQITTPVMDTLDTNKTQITTPVMDTLDTGKAQITTPVMEPLNPAKPQARDLGAQTNNQNPTSVAPGVSGDTGSDLAANTQAQSAQNALNSATPLDTSLAGADKAVNPTPASLASPSGNKASASNASSGAASAGQKSATSGKSGNIAPTSQTVQSVTATSGAETPTPAQNATLLAQHNTAQMPIMLQPTAEAGLMTSTSPETLTYTGTELDLTAAKTEARTGMERTAQQMPRFTPQSATQLAAQISRKFNNGNKVFEIRLDPAELGKVNVKLELQPDQRVQAILTVERSETLNELQRTARELEKALNEAGLELSNDGLEFLLNDSGNEPGFDEENGPDTYNIYTQTDDLEAQLEMIKEERNLTSYGFLLSQRDSVDLRI